MKLGFVIRRLAFFERRISECCLTTYNRRRVLVFSTLDCSWHQYEYETKFACGFAAHIGVRVCAGSSGQKNSRTQCRVSIDESIGRK